VFFEVAWQMDRGPLLGRSLAAELPLALERLFATFRFGSRQAANRKKKSFRKAIRHSARSISSVSCLRPLQNRHEVLLRHAREITWAPNDGSSLMNYDTVMILQNKS
jgi:hypothetical protein